MNYFRALILLITVALLTSCEEGSKSPLLLDSISSKDEVLIVADETLLNSFLKKDVQSKFMSSFDVLPQAELKLRATFVPFKSFERTFKRFEIIYLFADLSSNSSISEFVAESLGEENVLKALSNDDFFVVKKENAWAKPQNVYLVFAKSQEALKSLIKEKGDYLAKKALDLNIKTYRKELYAYGEENLLTKQLKDALNLNLPVPKGFVMALNNDSVFWLRQEIEYGSLNVWGYVKTLDTVLVQNNGIKYRDELGKQYISTVKEGTYLATDSVLPIITEETQINGLQGYVNRGLWQMENDFMGGPFVNYHFLDFEGKREIMIDAFVYAPGDKKKPHVRRLEAMVNQLKP